uniref:Uncharacterized protein n=1 Tax=Rhizophora mucronata TaxID=61149 RepID=A0A2P2NR25_RHIMU
MDFPLSVIMITAVCKLFYPGLMLLFIELLAENFCGHRLLL